MPFFVCPATCELCGHWIPQHSGSCPRNGVHPSNWSKENGTEPAVNLSSSYIDIPNTNLIQDEMDNENTLNSLNHDQ
ncbi:hypothetical protein BJ944DRAFT_273513 [Cunninghamella echinulata]|nr:hypothetical protein BJ944DRAFT_273513 [Cunninghamella echinulata]